VPLLSKRNIDFEFDFSTRDFEINFSTRDFEHEQSRRKKREIVSRYVY
jgi:hypothetical protein